jgi:MraZ protein
MFAGEYLCKLDEKGRFIIPPAVREKLESGTKSVVFVKGTEQAVWIYTAPEWFRLLERMKSTLDEEQSRLFMHHVVAEAGVSEIDKAGRVLIPGRLRKLIPVDEDQEVVLVGLYERLEVWNPSEWRRYLARVENRQEESLAKIFNLL